MAAGDDLGIERQHLGPAVAGAERVERAHGEAVDIGAVERGRVCERNDIVRQHAAERLAKRHALGGKRRKLDAPGKAAARLVGRHNFEELFLPRRGAHARQQLRFGTGSGRLGLAHGHGHTRTAEPAE